MAQPQTPALSRGTVGAGPVKYTPCRCYRGRNLTCMMNVVCVSGAADFLDPSR